MEKLTRVKFSNLDKVLYPELRLTKKDVIEHYIKVAPRMLPFLRERTLVRTRYPDGIGEGKPDWVETFTKYSKSSDKYTSYIVCNNLDTLLWLANLAALEMHTPLSKIPDTGKPDLILFDIDPEPPAGIREAVQVALLDGPAAFDIGQFSFLHPGMDRPFKCRQGQSCFDAKIPGRDQAASGGFELGFNVGIGIRPAQG